MSVSDVIVLLIIGSFMYAGYSRGLIKTIFNFISMMVSLGISNMVYPYVSLYLRETGAVYGYIYTYIAKNLALEGLVGEQTLKMQTEFIHSLQLPFFLTEGLLSNNNPEFYKLLRVESLDDYIVGYLTNICINMISMLVVFAIVGFIMRLIYKSLGLIGRLPVIRGFNRLGGLGFGFCQGTIVVWIGMIVITLFNKQQINEMLAGSIVAGVFYEKNILMDMVASILI